MMVSMRYAPEGSVTAAPGSGSPASVNTDTTASETAAPLASVMVPETMPNSPTPNTARRAAWNVVSEPSLSSATMMTNFSSGMLSPCSPVARR